MGKKIKQLLLAVLLCFLMTGCGYGGNSGETYRVQISIRCDNAVAKGLCEQKKWKGILPEDGVILPDTEVEVQEGDTVLTCSVKSVMRKVFRWNIMGAKGQSTLKESETCMNLTEAVGVAGCIASMVNTRIWDVVSASWPMEMWSAGIIPVIWAWISMQICREHRSGWIRMSNRKGGRRSEISDEHNNVL